ncbi:MAG: hypothetical protein AB7T06_43325 [Kofleriaceae bacterium]
MSRRWIFVLLVAVLTRSAIAGPDDRTLSAREVQTYVAPYVPAVRACFLANAKGKHVTGALRLELIIHHHGRLYRFGFAAPGVEKPWLARLDKCLRDLAQTWTFPERKGFTTAVLPFLFQKTSAPNAGPIESCWDPRGCPPGKLGKGGRG